MHNPLQFHDRLFQSARMVGMPDRKLQIQSDVYLERGRDEVIFLIYRGKAYEDKDVVPVDIYPYPPQRNKNNAHAFARTSMKRAHGPSPRDWPPLAKEFLRVGSS